MELKRLLELAGVSTFPKAKRLIEAESKMLPVYYVTDRNVDILKPSRYQGGRQQTIRAYRNKLQAMDNAEYIGKRSDLIVYELDQAEFPHKAGDVLTTMFFVVPLRRYPV